MLLYIVFAFALVDFSAILIVSSAFLFLILHLLLSSNSVKSKTTEERLAGIVAGVGTANTDINTQTGRINNLSGNSTGTGQPAGTPTGGVNGGGSGGFEVGPSDNGGVTSGQIGGAAAHYHAMSHSHAYDHTHDFDGHTHPLPTV